MLACYRQSRMDHNAVRASISTRQAGPTRPFSNGYLALPDASYIDSCSISSNDTESRTVDSGVSLSTQNSQQRALYPGTNNPSPSSPPQPPRSTAAADVWPAQLGPHTPLRYNPPPPQPPQRLCHNPLYSEQHIMESALPDPPSSSFGSKGSSPKYSRGPAPPPPPPYTALHNVLYVNAPSQQPQPPHIALAGPHPHQHQAPHPHPHQAPHPYPHQAPHSHPHQAPHPHPHQTPHPHPHSHPHPQQAARQSVETQTEAVQVPTSLAATISALRLFRGSGGSSLERSGGPSADSRRSTLTRQEVELELGPSAAKEMTDSVLMGLSSLSQKLKRSLTLSGGGQSAADASSAELSPAPRPLPRMPAGVCKVCRQKIASVEEACSAMGNIYHNACFTCCCCGKTLRGKIFYNDHGKIYCEEDYMYCGFQHTAEKCEACGHIITDMILNALGKSFHPGCFRCSVCKKCLDGVPFTVDMANKVYCIQDYHRVYAPKCASCALPIVPIEGSDEVVRVVAMDKDFHIDCYKCEDCKLQLTDEQDRRCYPMTGPDGALHLLCHGCHLARYARLPVRSPRAPPKHQLSELSAQAGPGSPFLPHHHPHHHSQPTPHRP